MFLEKTVAACAIVETWEPPNEKPQMFWNLKTNQPKIKANCFDLVRPETVCVFILWTRACFDSISRFVCHHTICNHELTQKLLPCFGEHFVPAQTRLSVIYSRFIVRVRVSQTLFWTLLHSLSSSSTVFF